MVLERVQLALEPRDTPLEAFGVEVAVLAGVEVASIARSSCWATIRQPYCEAQNACSRRRAVDLVIAATANAHHVPLLTHNVKDFQVIVDLVDVRTP